MADTRLTAAFDAIQTVTKTLNKVKRSIYEQSQSLTTLNASYTQNTGVTQVAEESQASLAREVNDVNRALGEGVRAMSTYNVTASTTSGVSTQLAAASQAASRGLDSVGDNASQATRKLGVYNAMAESTAFSMGALSVNVGAFTIALRDLGTQIPILLTTLGSLGAVAGGVAGALTMLAGAISFFAIGGAIAMWEDMESQFGDTEEAAEALEGVMRALLDLFMAAFEPLANQENAEFLITMVDWVAKLTNRFAQFFNQVRPMIMDFLSNVSDATDDIDNMFTAMARGWQIVQPAMEAMFVWLNNRLPGAIIFMSQTVEELREPLSRLIDSALSVTTALIDMAGGAMPAIVTVVELLLAAIEAVANMLNFLGDGMTELIFTMLAMAFAANKVLGSVNALAPIFSQLLVKIHAVTLALARDGLISALGLARRYMSDFLGLKYSNLDNLSGGVRRLTFMFQNLTTAFVGFSNRVAALPKRLWASVTAVGGLKSALISLLPAINTVNGALTMSGVSGFVSKSDVTILGLLKAQLYQVSAALLGYAQKAVLAAIAATRSLITRFLLASLAGLQLFGALHTLLIPGLARTGATANLTSAAMGNLQKALAGTRIAAILTGISLNVAFAGIPALIAGIIAVGALLVGMLGNMDKTINILRGAWDGLKNVLENIGSSLLQVFIPAWNLMVEVFAVLVNILMFIPRILNSIAQRLGLVGEGGSLLANIFGTVVDAITWAIERLAEFLEMLEDAVGRFNELLGGGDTLEGAKVTEAGVRENLARDRETADDEVQSEPDMNLSFDDSLEQNIDVQADPEDREQMRRTVKDAMNEANALQRRREGHGG